MWGGGPNMAVASASPETSFSQPPPQLAVTTTLKLSAPSNLNHNCQRLCNRKAFLQREQLRVFQSQKAIVVTQK